MRRPVVVVLASLVTVCAGVAPATGSAAPETPASVRAQWDGIDAADGLVERSTAEAAGSVVSHWGDEVRVTPPASWVDEGSPGDGWVRNVPRWVGSADAEGWTSIAFDEAGVIRIRLAHRDSASHVRVSGNEAVQSDVVGDGVSEYSSIGAGMAETFALVDSSRIGPGGTTLEYELDLPAGVEALQSGPAILIRMVGGATLVTVRADSAFAESGAEIPVRPVLDPDASTFSIDVEPASFDVLGQDVAVDPTYSWSTTGRVSRLYCPSTVSGNPACEITSSTQVPGWSQALDTNDHFNAGPEVASSPAWGMYMSAQNESIPQYDTVVWRYIPMATYQAPGINLETISMNGYLKNTSGHFECRLRGYDGFSSDVSSWRTITGNWSPSITYSYGRYVWAGMQLIQQDAGSQTGSSGNNDRCNLQNVANSMELILYDQQYPDSIAPASVAVSTPTGQEPVYDADASDGVAHWYRSGDVITPWYDVDDIHPTAGEGTGIEFANLQTNGVTRSSVSLCPSPDAMALHPCDVDPAPGYKSLTLASGNSSNGSNAVGFDAADFSHRATSASYTVPTSTYWYDGSAPANPANWTPSPGAGATNIGSGDNTRTLTWAAATESGSASSPPTNSGLDHYDVKFGTTSTLSGVSAESAPSASYVAQLGAASTYYWQVRAVDVAGNASAWSSIYNFSIDNAAPGVAMSAPVDNLSKRASGSEAWSATASDAGSGVSSVEFQRRLLGASAWSTVGAGSLNAGTWSYSADMPSDGMYEVRAIATDAASGSANASTSPSLSVCRDTASLGQPSGALHSFVGAAAQVWWSAPGTPTGVVGYIVERRATPSGSFTEVARVPSTVTTIADPGPLSGTAYEWRVQSIGQSCTTEATSSGGAVSTLDANGTTVTSPASHPLLGRESYFTSIDEDLGAGATAAINVAGGNITVEKPLTENQGRGLDTDLVLAYNSQDVTGEPSELATGGLLGPRWSLGLANLAPGDGIDSFTGVSVGPLRQIGSELTLRDANGAQHVFTADGSPSWRFDAPAGTFLYVRDWNAAGESSPGAVGVPATTPTWLATRPDRVMFSYATSAAYTGTQPVTDGRLLAVVDRSGNTLSMEYECVEVNDATRAINVVALGHCADTTAPTAGTTERYRLHKITDAGGRDMSLSYQDTGADATTGRLEYITDHAGTGNGTTRLLYAASGANRSLETIREANGTSVERDLDLGYGADIAATHLEDESQRLATATDARGNTTSWRYATPDREPLPRVVSLNDRSSQTAGNSTYLFHRVDTNNDLSGSVDIYNEAGGHDTYDWHLATDATAGRVTRYTDANAVTTRHDYDATNRETARREIQPRITDETATLTGTTPDPLNQTDIDTTQTITVRSAAGGGGTLWSEGADYIVGSSPASIARPASGSGISSGATVYVSYTPIRASWISAFDTKTGLPTSQTDPGEDATTTTYTNNSALDGYVADPDLVTSPRGTATTSDSNDYQTNYDYDAANRVASIARPINYATGDAADVSTTEYGYYSNGNVKFERNGRGYSTGYSDYDASGLAQRVHERISGTFNTANDPVVDDATTPVDTLLAFDVRGNMLCSDDKREAGDSPAISACATNASNTIFEEHTFDPLRRQTTSTTPWDGTRRRAERTTFDANSNPVAVKKFIGYTPGTTTPSSPDAATRGSVTASTYDQNDLEIEQLLPPNYDRYTNSTAYAAGACVAPTDPDNTQAYIVASAGTSAASEPTWPTAINGTVTSGGATFQQANSCKRRVTNEYDAAERLIRATQPQGNATAVANDFAERTTYDTGGRTIATLDGEGALRCTFYDAYNNEVDVSEPMAMNAGTTTCPSAKGSLDSPGWITTSAYDQSHNKTSEVNLQGGTTAWTYDADGNQASETLPKGVATGGDADDFMTSTIYDPDGNEIEVQEAQLAVCASAGVASKTSCSSTTTLRPKTTKEYDKAGNLSWERSPRGHAETSGTSTYNTTTYVYDVFDQEILVYLPYDADTLDLTTQTVYNALGQATRKIGETIYADPDNVGIKDSDEEWLAYHPDGNVASDTNNRTNHAETSITYSVYGKKASSTVNGTTNTYAYFPDGSLDSDNNTDSSVDLTEHVYDRSGKEIETWVNSGKVAWVDSYSKVGEDVKVYEQGGSIHRYEYDRNGHETKRTTGSIVEAKTYGSSGTSRGLQTHTLFESTAGTDYANIDYTWDADGNIATVTRDTSHDIKTTYAFAAESDDLASVNTEMVSSPNTDYQTISVTRDVAHDIRKSDRTLRLATASYATDNRTYQFDARQRLSYDSAQSRTVDGLQYAYDSRGRISTVTCESGGNADLASYTYDTPTDATHSAQVKTIGMRPDCGNARKPTNTLAYSTSGVNKGNLDTVTGGAHSYDFNHDARGELTTAEKDSLPETRTFNAKGRRLTTNYDGATKTNGFGGGGAVSSQSSVLVAGGHDDIQVVTDPEGRQVAEIRNGTTYWVISDENGSTVSVLDSTEAVTKTDSYDSYGHPDADGIGLESGSASAGAVTGFVGKVSTASGVIDTSTGGLVSDLKVGTDPEDRIGQGRHTVSCVLQGKLRLTLTGRIAAHGRYYCPELGGATEAVAIAVCIDFKGGHLANGPGFRDGCPFHKSVNFGEILADGDAGALETQHKGDSCETGMKYRAFVQVAGLPQHGDEVPVPFHKAKEVGGRSCAQLRVLPDQSMSWSPGHRANPRSLGLMAALTDWLGI